MTPCPLARSASGGPLLPAVKALPNEQLARVCGGGYPVRSALRAAEVDLEASVRLGDELIAHQVRLGHIAERLVWHARPVGPPSLHGEVDEAGGPAVTGYAVARVTVYPGLLIGEVGAVAAQLARRTAEDVKHRVARIPGLQRQIEGLAQILGEETKPVDPLRARCRVVILEDLRARRLQPVAELTHAPLSAASSEPSPNATGYPLMRQVFPTSPIPSGTRDGWPPIGPPDRCAAQSAPDRSRVGNRRRAPARRTARSGWRRRPARRAREGRDRRARSHSTGSTVCAAAPDPPGLQGPPRSNSGTGRCRCRARPSRQA